MCGAITALLHGTACLTSTELAAAVGPFDGFDEEPRADAARDGDALGEGRGDQPACPTYLQEAARTLWDEVLGHGRRNGFRNAQATVLAPTGTISFMMDCDTTGIEPDIALVKYKQLAGGGMLKIVNQTVPLALQTLGLRRAADRGDHRLHRPARHDRRRAGIEAGASAGLRLRLPAAQRHAFDRLAGAHPDDGGRAAVHLRRDLENGEHAHGQHARRHRRRLHGRLAAGPEGLGDLSRRLEGNPAALDQQRIRQGGRQAIGRARAANGCPTRGNRSRTSSTSPGHEGYITVGLYPDGRPGELFITMAKEGSTIGGLMDCFGTAVSMSLQYGVPLEVYVNKFSHTRFEPMGHTKNPDIRIAKSIVDYIFRWLGITFLPGYREAMLGHPPDRRTTAASARRETRDTEPRPAATKAGGPIVGPRIGHPSHRATRDAGQPEPPATDAQRSERPRA